MSGEKAWRHGTHRAVPPAATLDRLRPLLPQLGITRLADVTGLDRIGLPVFQAIRPLSRSVSVSQGKGLGADAARASALMEAVETWHAERIDRPLRLARETELREQVRIADTARLPLVAGSSYEPSCRTLWIEGCELGSGEPIWLPYETVHTDYTLPLPPGSGHFLASSNGLAAGNERDEALCHAICEVIERDAVALWFQAGTRAQASTAVDPSTVDDPLCREALGHCAGAGFGLSLWHVTSDLGVPAFLALLADERDPHGHGGLGAGCHPAREIALLRAVTEAVQVRMTYISGARDDVAAAEYRTGARAERQRQARRLAARSAGGLDYAQLPTASHPTFAADLAWLRERLTAAGLTAIAVDLARPEIGIPVVRVVILGLEGPDDHPSYSPGPRARSIGDASA